MSELNIVIPVYNEGANFPGVSRTHRESLFIGAPHCRSSVHVA
jgi:hypothetical protein